jgi:putative transposase
MKINALKVRPRRRYLPPDAGERMASAIAPNVLDRQFHADSPNAKWIADFTPDHVRGRLYVWTAEGWLYVAVVIDLFSRRAVGWSMSAAMTAQLVIDVLLMAIWRIGKPRPCCTIRIRAVNIPWSSSSGCSRITASAA